MKLADLKDFFMGVSLRSLRSLRAGLFGVPAFASIPPLRFTSLRNSYAAPTIPHAVYIQLVTVITQTRKNVKSKIWNVLSSRN